MVTDAWLRRFQEHLVAELVDAVPGLSARTRAAFLAVPRHLFCEQYRRATQDTWQRVDDDNLADHLPTIYRDNGMAILGDDTATAVTISGPSWVATQLELLALEPGHRVFELGAGSGWNAALLGHLVGPGGAVETIEILPELAARARRAIARAGIDNVEVVCGDGGRGPASDEPFDRAVFTAGSYDIPARLHAQVRVGGLLLLVLKFPGGGDLLTLFRREDDHFVKLVARQCMAVPVTGPSRDDRHDAVPLDAFAPWAELAARPLGSRPLLCGDGRGDFAARTFDLRSYLSIVEPRLRCFLDARDRDHEAPPWTGCTAFGLWDEPRSSLALARGTEITTYGGPAAGRDLDAHLDTWLALGLPSAAAFALRAYPRARAPAPAPGEWAVDRRDTRFLWRA
jgi:protein-L-isoaspartate(D-aspartate) O-methyltransferase